MKLVTWQLVRGYRVRALQQTATFKRMDVRSRRQLLVRTVAGDMILGTALATVVSMAGAWVIEAAPVDSFLTDVLLTAVFSLPFAVAGAGMYSMLECYLTSSIVSPKSSSRSTRLVEAGWPWVFGLLISIVAR